MSGKYKVTISYGDAGGDVRYFGSGQQAIDSVEEHIEREWALDTERGETDEYGKASSLIRGNLKALDSGYTLTARYRGWTATISPPSNRRG